MRWGILLAVLAFCPVLASGQTAFARGKHMLELTGIFNTYFRYVDPEGGPDEYAFVLRDARFLMTGESGRRFKYQLMVDFADLLARDTLDPFLKDAWVNIDLPAKFDLILGYQLVPFGRSSNVSIFSTVFTRRPAISGGALYYRRNLGLVLKKKLWRDLINGYVGAFNGNNRLRRGAVGLNQLSYVARADISFPTRGRFEAIDVRQSPLPRFSLGVNGMYTNHREELIAEGFPLEINGEKWITAIDFAFFFQGFVLQVEATRAWGRRRPNPDPGLARRFTASGLHLEGNYYLKNLRSILALRSEWYNPDDSRFGETLHNLAVAYNFLFDQSQDRVIRLEYRTFLSGENIPEPSGRSEVHLGLQFRF